MNANTPHALAQRCAEQMFQQDTCAQAMGMRVDAVDAGFAQVSMTVGPQMLNGHQTCHGGQLFSLADTRLRLCLQQPGAGGGGVRLQHRVYPPGAGRRSSDRQCGSPSSGQNHRAVRRGNRQSIGQNRRLVSRACSSPRPCHFRGTTMSQAFICDGVRTPIGRYGGALANVRADDLAALPLRALVARHPQVDWSLVDDVILGCANQAGEDNRNLARMATLLAGLPVNVSGTTVNRLCGSGLDALAMAARSIKAGETRLVLAGGAESMTRAPLVMGKADTAFSRQAQLYDTTLGWRFINPLMQAQYGTDSMPETAENVAAQFNISRADQDAFALRSQQRAARAQDLGLLAQEIVPVSLSGKKGAVTLFSQDEHPRADTRLEQLQGLKTPFRQPGTVTAGNASGLNDGAAALIVASEAMAVSQGLTPRARIVATATCGVEPGLMGIGPLPATRKVLELAGLSLAQMDVIELNEAFAAQALAVLRQLGLPDDAPQVNPNGGAIALGHPLGMSGARLALAALFELERRSGRYALCTMCIGVGQGIAMIIERV
ncbi:Beta-ketoadipyl-CoA thiolase [Serratia proteamaculans]|nr:Beta-ketoadipyl-CoA thiolase [Serratia proteamaculans]